jgi:hypothetical protein
MTSAVTENTERKGSEGRENSRDPSPKPRMRERARKGTPFMTGIQKEVWIPRKPTKSAKRRTPRSHLPATVS